VIRPHRVLALASLALAALGAAPAAAIEYRLRVANVRDEAFTSFLTSGELHDGATGPGLDRLESSLDTGDFPKAVLLYDRHSTAVLAWRERYNDREAPGEGFLSIRLR